MKFKDDCASLVIAGTFNIAIFNNLEWVQKFLFPNEQIKSEFSLNPFASSRYTTADFRLSIVNNTLQLFLIKREERELQKLENMALKIADYLPHTPVSGMGTNFIFESTPTDHVNINFPEPEKEKLLEEGFETKAVVMQVKCENQAKKYILNKIISHENNVWTFSFNYHYEIKSLVDLKEILQPNTINGFCQESLNLMAKLYDLHLQ